MCISVGRYGKNETAKETGKSRKVQQKNIKGKNQKVEKNETKIKLQVALLSN